MRVLATLLAFAYLTPLASPLLCAAAADQAAPGCEESRHGTTTEAATGLTTQPDEGCPDCFHSGCETMLECGVAAAARVARWETPMWAAGTPGLPSVPGAHLTSALGHPLFHPPRT